MKINIEYINQPPHTLVFRKCAMCGRRFAKYHKAIRVCSQRCKETNRQEYDKERWQKIKQNPEMRYKHRRVVIEQREKYRRDKILADLPNIKRALNDGDDVLVQYLFDHYCMRNNKERRKYKKK